MDKEFFTRMGYDTSKEPYCKNLGDGDSVVYKNYFRDGSGRYEGFVVTHPKNKTVRTEQEFLDWVTSR